MASNFSLPKLCKNALFSLLLMFMVMVVAAASFQFNVGGRERGWIKPTGNESETYNEWAARNRFHVGDSLYFKYENDSVLVVNKTSYSKCSVSNPIFKFEDGETVFQFHRYGFFYFISGERGHCKAGQRLIVRVMVHPAATPSPEPAPSPQGDGSGNEGGGWDSFWGPPPPNSTIKLTVASYFMTALGGMLVIMYLLM
ncbi:Plastocyanin-like protein [Corchorus capsularis]|uniref:Plastocyanin-like protein n=1 Tax=Corchorus capsularis TaxID=210143 RepID=A0A1R3IMH2_COCAP|nr:Plastocyanin-like protein [Corchorus capsularis]